MQYIIDSNILIEAYRMTYPMDVVVSFWSKFSQLAASGKIISLDKVKNELYQYEDDLKSWCSSNLPSKFWVDFDSIYQYSLVSTWADGNKQYDPRAKHKFLNVDKADAFLVAFASANRDRYTIVSEEVSAVNAKREIKLPDASAAFNVKCINTMDLFRVLQETF